MIDQLTFQILFCLTVFFALLSVGLAIALVKSRKYWLENATVREDRIDALEKFRLLAGKAQHLDLLGCPFLVFPDCSIFAEVDEFGLKCVIKSRKDRDYGRDLELKLWLGHKEVLVVHLGYDTTHESIQNEIQRGLTQLLESEEERGWDLRYIVAIRKKLAGEEDDEAEDQRTGDAEGS